MGENTANGYFYKPALGASGATEKDLFDAKLDIADAEIKANKDVRHTQGTDYSNIVICADYDHPDDAITAIGADNKTLLVTEEETCDTNFTVPANVMVKFERGGKWTINTGITVTFNGKINAGLWQTFTYAGTGTLNFGAEATEKVYPQWWGAVTGDATDDSTAIINAIKSLPSTGGTVYLVAGMYRCDNSITFPITDGLTKNIRIQGESSGLANGGATNVFGTRIDSYIADGALFDLYTDSPECFNVQFRDLECYDREATGENYGIKASEFKAGCIIENVGFKLFTTSVYISKYCYYSKFDRVASFYARDTAMYIEGCNGVLFNRIQCANGDAIGLYLKASVTHLRGVTVLNSWFEGNAANGMKVMTATNYRADAINIIGCYFEKNGTVTHDHHLYVAGVNATDTIYGGVIMGNYFAASVNAVSINLGYAKGILVQGNKLYSYYDNLCISSSLAVDCQFNSNVYNPDATTKLSVPDDNYYNEPDLDKVKLPNVTSLINLTSGQIAFPATQVPSAGANTLDDYEEGTWTAVIRGSDTAGTYEIASQISNYTKIGRVVHLESRITLADTITGGGTEYLYITGCPFTKMANSRPMGSVATDGVDFTGSYLNVCHTVESAISTLKIVETNDNASFSTLPISSVSANDKIYFSITFFQ